MGALPNLRRPRKRLSNVVPGSNGDSEVAVEGVAGEGAENESLDGICLCAPTGSSVAKLYIQETCDICVTRYKLDSDPTCVCDCSFHQSSRLPEILPSPTHLLPLG